MYTCEAHTMQRRSTPHISTHIQQHRNNHHLQQHRNNHHLPPSPTYTATPKRPPRTCRAGSCRGRGCTPARRAGAGWRRGRIPVVDGCGMEWSGMRLVRGMAVGGGGWSGMGFGFGGGDGFGERDGATGMRLRIERSPSAPSDRFHKTIIHRHHHT